MGLCTRQADSEPSAVRQIVEWEETDCLLCGSPRWRLIAEAPDRFAGSSGLWFAVVKCKDCGLCFTNPRPSPASIAHFYPPVYFCQRAPGPLEKPSRKVPGRLRIWRLGAKERKVLPVEGGGRLLDFGCGGGSYLQRMSRQGWQVTGVEMAGELVDKIKAELGLQAVVGSLPHTDLQPGSFDVITMWHSLEHVHDPMEILRQAYFLLSPRGKLLIATPNIESLPFEWFKHCWYGLDLPRHLTHFSPNTLTWMLERSGFRVGPIRMIRRSSWLRASARLACSHGRSSHWRRALTCKTGSRLASWYACMTKRSDYMMVTARRTD
jgi:SAM-dependent methyltransferase